MTKRSKLVAGTFLIVAVVTLLLLAIGLNGLQMKEGESFALNFDQPATAAPQVDLPGSQLLFNIIRWIYFLAWAMVPVIIIMLIISPNLRKQLLKFLARFIPIAIIMIIALNFLTNSKPQPTGETGVTGPSGLPTGAPAALPTLPPFNPGSDPQLVLILTVVSAAFLAGLTAFGVWVFWLRKQKTPDSLLVSLEQPARQALDNLQAGGDLRNAIIRCYQEMTQVVRQERNLSRDISMTPSEFVRVLVHSGLPEEPVTELTHLFEEVRYGPAVPGSREERRAILSLSAILEACHYSK
jgi:hypothetical protein